MAMSITSSPILLGPHAVSLSPSLTILPISWEYMSYPKKARSPSRFVMMCSHVGVEPTMMHRRRISKSILYQPTCGYKFILNTSSFTNGEEGINEHGLVAAMTFAIPKITEIKAGLNSVFLVRYLLEKCKTTKESIAAIQSLPVSSNCNILIADKSGDMVVIECNPYQKHIRYPMVNEYGNKFIITVNELLSSEMVIHKARQGDTFFSKERYSTAENALLKLKDNPIDNAKAILSGKCGFMCQYAKELHFDTVWATILNLSDLKIYRAEGNPNKKSFVSDDRLM